MKPRVHFCLPLTEKRNVLVPTRRGQSNEGPAIADAFHFLQRIDEQRLITRRINGIVQERISDLRMNVHGLELFTSRRSCSFSLSVCASTPS